MTGPDRVRVARIIARMNVGGPAHQVSILSGRLDPNRYETLLLSGQIGSGESSAADLAHLYRARLVEVPALGPELSPTRDLRALLALSRLLRNYRPHIVHTHTAKAGLLGRLAATVAISPRPIIVHTYHGHVLEGYFDPVRTAVFRSAERLLAHVTDRLVAVSDATVDDLVRLKVAPRERFTTIPVGLDLEPFTQPPNNGSAFRAQAGAQTGDVLLTYTGRLAPIKRVDLLLRGLALARSRASRLRLAVVGDGDLRGDLERFARELGIADIVTFLGYRTDLPAIVAGSDVAVLSSANEGTPVALIEAAAGGVPAVATRVGGVTDVVCPEGGILVAPGDPVAFAAALVRFAHDPSLRQNAGASARAHVLTRFSMLRLLEDIDALYSQLLHDRSSARRASTAG